jgi:alpha-tubulin suppressor-like RCC1 family protein
VEKVSVNTSNSLFLTSDGQVYACGSGDYGKNQNNSTASANLPVRNHQFAAGVTDISMGLDTSFVLVGDLMVSGYGYSGNGEIGHGGNANSTTGRTWDFKALPVAF